MPNLFKSYQSTSITTETTVYTGPANTQTTIIGLSTANIGTSPAYVSLKLNTAHIVKNAPVPVGSSLISVGGDQKIVVESGDTLSVSSDNPVDVIISVLEIS